MSKPRVRALRAIEISVTDVSNASDFFADVWNLAPVASHNGVTYLRGTGAHHWITSVQPAHETGIVRIVFDAADRATLDALRAQVTAAGAREVQAITRLDTPGGGIGFGFKDPEGRNLAVVAEVADHADSADAKDTTDVEDRPRKLSHVNIHSVDGERCFAFFRDGLGFRLSDQTPVMWFIRCNSDHASIVISKNAEPTLNHIAWEMPAWEDVMRGIGRMRDHGYALGWGPGRHGAGDAVFAYFIGYESLPIEYAAEQLIVDDDNHVPAPMSRWKWPAGRLDHWGLMPRSSDDFLALKDRFGFSENGHLL